MEKIEDVVEVLNKVKCAKTPEWKGHYILQKEYNTPLNGPFKAYKSSKYTLWNIVENTKTPVITVQQAFNTAEISKEDIIKIMDEQLLVHLFAIIHTLL